MCSSEPGVLDNLKQLFPDIPVSKIESALAEAKGDSNQAADMLMTEKDPDPGKISIGKLYFKD